MASDEVAKRAIAGNEQAFVELIRQYEEPLYRVAYSYMHNEHDALEAMQELSYRSFRTIRKVKEPQYIGTWLTRITINICIDMLKKQKREIPVERIADEQYSYESAHEYELYDLLSQLDEPQREMIMMKYVEERRNAEIAQKLNIPEGTVKSRLHHSLRKLKMLFREEGM